MLTKRALVRAHRRRAWIINKRYKKRMKERSKFPIRMLFSSFGFRSPIMREKFAQVIPTDETLAQKTCVIVPFAGFDPEKTAEREKQGLIEFGFNPDNIRIADSYGLIGYSFPDYIYVSGGDPFKLLAVAKTGFLIDGIRERVMDKRAVYIGVSAGADFATHNIEYLKQVEDNNYLADDFFALSLVPRNILCHYDHYSYPTLKACEEFGKRPIMTINDDQLLMYENGKWSYIGEDE